MFACYNGKHVQTEAFILHIATMIVKHMINVSMTLHNGNACI